MRSRTKVEIPDPHPPKGEVCWVGYCDRDGNVRYVITSKLNNRDVYFLYANNGGKLERIGKGCCSPTELCRKNDVYGKLGIDA